jgi:hypothetical protein
VLEDENYQIVDKSEQNWPLALFSFPLILLLLLPSPSASTWPIYLLSIEVIRYLWEESTVSANTTTQLATDKFDYQNGHMVHPLTKFRPMGD